MIAAAQLTVTGRPDQVRALLHAIRDRHHVRLTLTRPPVRLDANTVAVHVDAVCDRPSQFDPPAATA